MIDGGRPLHVLDQILERYRVVQHGVSMYFGSAEPLDRDHLKRLQGLVKRTKTPWLTDHLCWGSSMGHTHTICCRCPIPSRLPVTPPKRFAKRATFLVLIAVENVSSYAEFHVAEMTEWEFLSAVVELADRGIILDVNNIYVSSRNHNFDPNGGRRYTVSHARSANRFVWQYIGLTTPCISNDSNRRRSPFSAHCAKGKVCRLH
jgi:uncharacterized protein